MFLHLGVESSSPEIRRSVHTVLAASTAGLPELTNRVVRDALTTFVSRGPPSPKAGSADEQAVSWNKESRLSTLLLSTVTFGDDVDLAVREGLIADLIVLAHHRLVG